jgi:hypothetical protein
MLNGHQIEVEVDPVEERPGETLLVGANLGGGTSTGTSRIPAVATWAGIHRENEHDTRGKIDAPSRARNCDTPVFDRGSERIKTRPAKFRGLIEEEYTAMCEAHLARHRRVASTDECNFTRCRMRGTKRWRRDEPTTSGGETRDAMDARDLDGFVETEGRQDTGQCPRE